MQLCGKRLADDKEFKLEKINSLQTSCSLTIVLSSQTVMQILQEIAAIALSYGLTINAEQTKALTTDGSPCTLCLENSQIEQVEEFKYLGSLVQQNKVLCSTEIHSRIGKAAMVFGSLTWCLWRKHSVSLMRVFRSIVMSILLYGAETWVPLKADLQKLEVFQMRCLRRILNVLLRDRITDENIRKVLLQPAHH
ncbi:unnamed protein product [Heligmosomoides polygyrus]|uniref:Reverse transcriptase domain-containing protein n=1 Tax=Heligmosomoides polygyrus TaxID=6339 RepID=A0A183G476_HELPZ|nr:unnamed protein product [Heligmosomoides polygyrus]